MVAQQKVTFMLSSELKKRLNALKDELDISFSAMFQEALEQYASQKERERIQEACEFMSHEYKRDQELKEWSEFTGDLYETV